MKRILALAFALLLLLPSLAFADVIVEPDNGFYRTHQKECQHREGRTYLADGPDGSLNLYTAPGGTVAETLQNGAAFYCQWTYTDKQGTCGRDEACRCRSCWVRCGGYNNPPK